MKEYGITQKIKYGLFSPYKTLKYLIGLDPSQFPLRKISKYLESNEPLIIEAGAFDGRDSLRMSKFWPKAKIFSFEAVPNLFNIAQSNCLNYPNIRVINLALSNEESQEIELYTFKGMGQVHGSSSILKPTLHSRYKPKIKFNEIIKVEAVTLDSWTKNIGISNIDLLWLDLQGAELKILSGAHDILQNTRVCHLEVSRNPLYEGAPTLTEVDDFMKSKGFKRRLTKILGVSGNAIYTR